MRSWRRTGREGFLSSFLAVPLAALCPGEKCLVPSASSGQEGFSRRLTGSEFGFWACAARGPRHLNPPGRKQIEPRELRALLSIRAFQGKTPALRCLQRSLRLQKACRGCPAAAPGHKWFKELVMSCQYCYLRAEKGDSPTKGEGALALTARGRGMHSWGCWAGPLHNRTCGISAAPRNAGLG